MKLRNKLMGALVAAMALIGGFASYAAYVQPLGGSIFPLVFVTQPVVNLLDAYNEMLALINAQVMGAGTVVSPPSGRLTLNSTVAVPIADVALTSNIWYIPYVGEMVPVNAGTSAAPSFSYVDIGPTGLTMQLSSSDTTAQNYDVYLVNNAGSLVLCNMSWGTGNTRSTTAAGGTNGASGSANAAIQQVEGIWTNKAAIATGNCFGGSTGVVPVSYALNSNQGTLLGTIYLTSTGLTQQNTQGAATTGGVINAGVYLSNAYNRVPVQVVNKDSTIAQTATTATWKLLGSSDSIYWVDSLAQEAVNYVASVVGGNATTGNCASLGVSLSSGGTPKTVSSTCNPGTGGLASAYQTLTVSDALYPILGLSSVSAEILASATTATYMPTASQMENFYLNLTY